MACLLKFLRFLLERNQVCSLFRIRFLGFCRFLSENLVVHETSQSIADYCILLMENPTLITLSQIIHVNYRIPCIQEPWPQNHHSFTSTLLQLHLNCTELAVNDIDHSLNFLGRDWSCSWLFSQQIHNMSRKFVTRLKEQWGRGELQNTLILWIETMCEQEYI